MSTSFFFYDLETSGINPRDARIMQFAGQRTDMDLNPVGEPVNVLIRLSEDVVPEPDAILVTGITPQQTQMDGITEAEFLKLFHEKVATPGTIFVGYNTVRFDDEFMRYLHYRNFYDPYEWQYTDGKSRWDLLDVVRMTRSLRPEGIVWPYTEDGKPTNRLELITKGNGIVHEHAHDALSDVEGTISVARLIREKQPKLFEYLLSMRDKKAVEKFISQGQPFLYSSGKYSGEFEKTTAAAVIAPHPRRQAVLVFDLRFDPAEFEDLSPAKLVELWRYVQGEGVRLPVKTLQFNRCPAVAPLATLDEASESRLKITKKQAIARHKQLRHSGLAQNILAALDILDAEQEKQQKAKIADVDAQLYDNFFDNADKKSMDVVRGADPAELSESYVRFKDKRLNELLPLYKARNFPSALSDEERAAWEVFKQARLLEGGQTSRLARFFTRLGEIAERTDLTSDQQYLLEELQLYGQSIIPATAD